MMSHHNRDDDFPHNRDDDFSHNHDDDFFHNHENNHDNNSDYDDRKPPCAPAATASPPPLSLVLHKISW